MSTVCVTGGYGYIGSMACKKLIECGFAVRIADSGLFRPDDAWWTWAQEQITAGKLSILPHRDISDFDESFFRGCYAVLHLAGMSNDPMAEYDPESNMRINHSGTLYTAYQAKRAGVQKFIFASSCSVYQGLESEDCKPLTEDSALNPTAPYSVSKLKAEQDLMPISSDNFAVTILRQGTVYGLSPRMRFDLVINAFVRDALLRNRLNLYSGGRMWRPLVSLSALCDAYVSVLSHQSKKVSGQIFNVGGDNLMICDLAVKVRDLLNSLFHTAPKIVDDNTPRKNRSYIVDSSKIIDTLGWSPESQNLSIDIEEIAKEVLEAQDDCYHPRHNNIEWLKIAEHMRQVAIV